MWQQGHVTCAAIESVPVNHDVLTLEQNTPAATRNMSTTTMLSRRARHHHTSHGCS